MDGASEEKVDILLKLGDQTLPPRKVPISEKVILTEAEKLYNDFYDRLIASPSMKNDDKLALTVLAFQLAVKYIELRDSKEDHVLAPAVERILGDVEEALDRLGEGI